MSQRPTDGVSIPALEAIELEVEAEAWEFARHRLLAVS